MAFVLEIEVFPVTELRRKRVRVIRDSEKYHKHQVKKLWRKIVWGLASGVVILLCVAFIWYMLHRMIQPPFQD